MNAFPNWLRLLTSDVAGALRTGWFDMWAEDYGLVCGPTRIPQIGEPNLMYFPAPLHPMEIAAAMRGWGGIRDGLPAAKARVIAAAHGFPKWSDSVREIGGPLFLSPGRALVAGHLFMPVETRADSFDRLETLKNWRHEIWAEFGFTATQVNTAIYHTAMGQEYSIDVPEFWSIVGPEWEDMQ